MTHPLDCMYIPTVSWPGVHPRDRVRGEKPTTVNTPHTDDATGPDLSCGLFHAGPRYRTIRHKGKADWLVMLTVGGAGRLRFDSGHATAQPRSATVYLQNTPQDYATCPDAGAWIFGFAHTPPRPLWTRIVSAWPQPRPGLAVLPVPDPAVWAEAWTAMTRARRLLAGPQHRRDELTRNALETALLWCDQANPARGPQPDPRVRRAAEFARQHADRPLTANDLARAAGLSPSRLSALFRQQLGESPARYAERLRLERAATLLATTGLSVKQAAAAAGYDDPYHFSRRFTQRLGRPPSQWPA